ncbi:uncharacterized protein PHALS_00586 [Plasmopara halstedii]|uniref:Uncharacterized protein n=1 Tax=Plasmopara halstedii TaxID=4781 RepID=A0A0P1B8F4_PLAHL|nr:uncharacterized protein PHALS_00586 [Plasmopara halstedii]CEG50441.1 hypothetical protein PHALS_00586 [Plasmopara halstedii]|eukprot:XP_024586810.1 hypothetical protein PHALS_00586 [Plasmopara halstedii]
MFKEKETTIDIVQLVNNSEQATPDEILAEAFKRCQCKKLRAACTKLGLHPQSEPSMNSKNGYIQLLLTYRRARRQGVLFTGYSKHKVTHQRQSGPSSIIKGRTPNCGFVLVNVIFCPSLITRIAESGAVPGTGKKIKSVDGNSKYWRDVAEIYASRPLTILRIEGSLGRYPGIDPTLAAHHSSVKLCAIWKEMVTTYDDCNSRWKQSETNHLGFEQFCTQMDVLYLHERLQLQPFRSMDSLQFSERVRTENKDRSSNLSIERIESDLANEVSLESQDSSTNGTHDGVQRLNAQKQISGNSRVCDVQQRNVLTRSEAVHLPIRQNSDVWKRPLRRGSGMVRDRVNQILNPKRHRVNVYEGIIFSSQAVRETMTALEALRNSRFDNKVIAQAEEKVDVIVQAWLRELDNVAHV